MYIDGPKLFSTKLFSDLYLVKFLVTSATPKSFRVDVYGSFRSKHSINPSQIYKIYNIYIYIIIYRYIIIIYNNNNRYIIIIIIIIIIIKIEDTYFRELIINNKLIADVQKRPLIANIIL